MSIDKWRTLTFLDSSFPLPLDAPFTTEQAAGAGLRAEVLTELCRRQLLRRVVKGVYVVTQLGDSLELRARALSLVVPEDCVICDGHAGWLHGADMTLAPNEHVELRPVSVFRPSGMGRLRNDLTDSGERNLRADDVTEVHGLRVTTPLRTAWDLGRRRSREASLSGMDAMLRLGQFDHSELIGGVPRFKGMRWVTRLRELAPLADGRAESPGESVLRLRWLDLSLPTPTPQVTIPVSDGRVLRVDVGNEDLLLGADYQGLEWHGGPDHVARDAQRAALIEDEGWVLIPVWKEDLWGANADVDRRLREGLVEARRRAGRRIWHRRRH